MPEKFEKLFEKYSNMDKPTRIAYAKVAASKLLTYLYKEVNLSKQESILIAFSIISLFISADKLVSDSECELFNRIFGTNLSLNELREFNNSKIDEDRIKRTDQIIDLLPIDLKAEVCILCLTFVSADGCISEEEKKMFDRVYLG